MSTQQKEFKKNLLEERERESEKRVERDCASQHRSSAYFSIKHTCCNTKNTHTFLKHTNAMPPPPNSPFDEAIASDLEEEKHIVFVPGRLCLLGEHSDWVRSYSYFIRGNAGAATHKLTHTFSLSFLQISSLKHDRRADLDEHIRPYQLALVSSSARAKAYPRPRLN